MIAETEQKILTTLSTQSNSHLSFLRSDCCQKRLEQVNCVQLLKIIEWTKNKIRKPKIRLVQKFTKPKFGKQKFGVSTFELIGPSIYFRCSKIGSKITIDFFSQF